MNTFQLVKHVASLARDGFAQLAFIKSLLRPLVIKHCQRIGYQLSPSEKKKALFYYPMYTVLACAQMYVTLKGRKLTKEETKRLTLVGAMATLCDDLIDEHNWTRDEVFDVIFNFSEKESLPGNAKLLAALNKDFYTMWNVPEKYARQLKTALEWEAVSAKQRDPSITLNEIVKICREKNGNTSLMFATLVNEEWTQEELDFIYQSAIVGQLTNDSFDVYFDSLNGIRTYFNTAPSIKQARQFFLDECRSLHAMVMKCNTSEQNKLNTIRRMSVLHGFTLTALDQLEATEKKYGTPVDWKSIPRKEVVLDMALNKNRLKTLKNIKWLAKQY